MQKLDSNLQQQFTKVLLSYRVSCQGIMFARHVIVNTSMNVRVCSCARRNRVALKMKSTRRNDWPVVLKNCKNLNSERTTEVSDKTDRTTDNTSQVDRTLALACRTSALSLFKLRTTGNTIKNDRTSAIIKKPTGQLTTFQCFLRTTGNTLKNTRTI